MLTRRRRWDYGTYKLHPLWNRPESTQRIRIGDVLFRGTTTKLLRNAHCMGEAGRIYLSEGEEDASGYASICAERDGGEPVLLEVRLTPAVYRRLKPGFEGLGEWYVEAPGLPERSIVKVREVDKEGNIVD